MLARVFGSSDGKGAEAGVKPDLAAVNNGINRCAAAVTTHRRACAGLHFCLRIAVLVCFSSSRLVIVAGGKAEHISARRAHSCQIDAYPLRTVSAMMQCRFREVPLSAALRAEGQDTDTRMRMWRRRSATGQNGMQRRSNSGGDVHGGRGSGGFAAGVPGDAGHRPTGHRVADPQLRRPSGR